MHSNSLLDSLIRWLLYLPTVAFYALLLLLCILAVMMVRPLIIDWLGVRSHSRAKPGVSNTKHSSALSDAHRPETLPQELAHDQPPHSVYPRWGQMRTVRR